MATIELVEQLRKHANVSYKDAKEALDATDDDMLEAIIYLESQGKVTPPMQGGSFTTQKRGAGKGGRRTYSPPPRQNRENIGSLLRKFFDWLVDVIRKGNQNMFIIHRNNEHVISLPITVLVLLLLFSFQTVIFILIIGLIIGFRYSFEGPDIKATSTVNSAMGDAAEVADTIKDKFTNNKPSDKEPQDE